MNPILALIIANIIWGAASPIFKFALINIPPFTLAFIRFFFAFLVLLPFILGRWKNITKRDLIEIIIAAFFGISLNITTFFFGLKKSTSINAPVIASIQPVLIYFLSIIFLKEKTNSKVFFGMMAALFGVFVIILSPLMLDGKTLDFGELEGNALFLIATIGAVIYTIMNKSILKKVPALELTLIGFIFSSLTFLPFMIGELRSWSFGNLDYHGWTGIIFGVFFSSALAYYLFIYAMEKIDAKDVGIFTYIDPVAAVILAIPLVNEYPNLYFFIGSVLVFGGIFLAEGRLHWHPIRKLKHYNMRAKTKFISDKIHS